MVVVVVTCSGSGGGGGGGDGGGQNIFNERLDVYFHSIYIIAVTLIIF